MLTRLSHVSSALLLLVFTLSGCARDPDAERRAVLENYANIVLATYEDSIAAARELDAAIDALLANPSEETLAVARDKWRAARIPYGYSEAFRFYNGPIDNEEDGPEGHLNGWPLDENHIDAVLLDNYNAAPGENIIGNPEKYPEITAELIAEQNENGGEKNIASGYHAIEFLLWGQDFNDPPESAGQRPYTDFIAGAPNDATTRRGQYLKAATALLIEHLEGVAAQWRDPPQGERNYRTDFIGGDVPTGLKRMFTGIAALSEVEMAGERLNVALLSSDQEEEQSCFSDTTSDDFRANAQGIVNVYYGKYTRLDGTTIAGPSLAALVKAKDPRIAEEMDARFERTREAIEALRSPFDREILAENAEGRARVQAAIDALRAQALSMTRAAQAIQIFLSDLEGLGD
jgi:putative iron-regulated protein